MLPTCAFAMLNAGITQRGKGIPCYQAKSLRPVTSKPSCQTSTSPPWLAAGPNSGPISLLCRILQKSNTPASAPSKVRCGCAVMRHGQALKLSRRSMNKIVRILIYAVLAFLNAILFLVAFVLFAASFALLLSGKPMYAIFTAICVLVLQQIIKTLDPSSLAGSNTDF